MLKQYPIINLYRILGTGLLLLLPLLQLSAQARFYNFEGNNRLFTGGGLGLQFGTITFVDVSPHLGYFITERLAAGTGFTYQHYKDRRFKPPFTADVIGGRVFARYHILDDFLIHTEYEILSYESALFDPLGLFIKPERVEVSNYLIGGGYRQAIAGRLYVNLLILWNLNETVYTLYDNPVIRMGIDIAL